MRQAPGLAALAIRHHDGPVDPEDRIIIGSDTGWYDPGQPAGFELEQVDGVWTMVGDYAGDYSMVPAEFVPAMQEAGFSEELITKLTQDNPWNAYSR